MFRISAERQKIALLGAVLSLVFACAGPRLYFVGNELPRLDGNPALLVAPGPWKNKSVVAVYSEASHVPDDLVLSALSALMALPGAASACDPLTGRPRPDATEYCLAFYKTPEDWRVSWPVRNMTGQPGSCNPPLGGVLDEDFGMELPVFGFAHNHPCGTQVSSQDLKVFPVMKLGESQWTMVEYAVSPSGRPALDDRGQLIPAWGWLASGHRDELRFYKWNPSGAVFQWEQGERGWRFLATCIPQLPSTLGGGLPPPKCTRESN
ncbi:hypothetical protein MEBOL_004952 [Melittangium boletus DSM 14713]|uniref:Lipoprotein n=1 Tax=Melittangium boletus DSM 14713 TaxID=1294270 RepID=A0A250II45_9BACT|nr:hypothetical protein MEBOL_004952 [Melittangium boletus DSM 14713]